MGRQINFFMMPDDLRELDKKIHEMGFLIIEDQMPTENVATVTSLLEGSLFKLLVLQEQIELCRIKYIDPQNHYVVNKLQSPVIEFIRPQNRETEGTLKEGRLYYETTWYSPQQKESNNHPPVFIKQSESLFRWIKRHFRNTQINRCLTTERTAEWISQSDRKLVNSFNKAI